MMKEPRSKFKGSTLQVMFKEVGMVRSTEAMNGVGGTNNGTVLKPMEVKRDGGTTRTSTRRHGFKMTLGGRTVINRSGVRRTGTRRRGERFNCSVVHEFNLLAVSVSCLAWHAVELNRVGTVQASFVVQVG